MASTKPKLSFFFFYLILATIVAAEDTIHLHYYFHDIRTGQNATSAVVASINGTIGFGTMSVFDGPITEGPELSSKLIGKVQGLNVMASLSDNSLVGMLNHVFVDGEYNGSTIAILGRSDAKTLIADRPIVGGSGQFRMARGYSIAKALVWNASYSLAEYDMYVMKYDN